MRDDTAATRFARTSTAHLGALHSRGRVAAQRTPAVAGQPEAEGAPARSQTRDSGDSFAGIRGNASTPPTSNDVWRRPRRRASAGPPEAETARSTSRRAAAGATEADRFAGTLPAQTRRDPCSERELRSTMTRGLARKAGRQGPWRHGTATDEGSSSGGTKRVAGNAERGPFESNPTDRTVRNAANLHRQQGATNLRSALGASRQGGAKPRRRNRNRTSAASGRSRTGGGNASNRGNAEREAGVDERVRVGGEAASGRTPREEGGNPQPGTRASRERSS